MSVESVPSAILYVSSVPYHQQIAICAVIMHIWLIIRLLVKVDLVQMMIALDVK